MVVVPYQNSPWCLIDDNEENKWQAHVYQDKALYDEYGVVLNKDKGRMFNRFLRKLMMTVTNKEEKAYLSKYMMEFSRVNYLNVNDYFIEKNLDNRNDDAVGTMAKEYKNTNEIVLFEEYLKNFSAETAVKITKRIEELFRVHTKELVVKKDSAALLAACKKYNQVFFWGRTEELRRLFYKYLLQNEIKLAGFIVNQKDEKIDDLPIDSLVFYDIRECFAAKEKCAVVIMESKDSWPLLKRALHFYGFDNLYFFDKMPNALYGQVSLNEYNGMLNCLENNDFTLISNNCTAGFIYHDLELEFLSPTINLFIPDEDYIRFLQNLDYYLAQEMTIDGHGWNEAEQYEYPIGRIDDVTIQFIHYASDEQAIKKWEERKKRIRKDNLFIIANGDFTQEQMEVFDSLPYKNKKIFSGIKAPQLKSCIWIKEFEEKYDHNLWFFPRMWYRYFNFIKWFNHH